MEKTISGSPAQTSSPLNLNDPFDQEIIWRKFKERKRYTFDLKRFCHPKQYSFVTDTSPYATAVTSRRAGKTVACAADLLDTARQIHSSTSLYITLTRANAKILLWPILKRINEQNHLGGTPNEADLSMIFGNGSVIYLSGVKDISEIDKFRGMALHKVYLDEAQSMKPYIRELIDDVLDPACIDHGGKMRVIGTPGPVPVGYFHDIAFSGAWSHHDFTIWDNPFIKNAKERLDLVLKRRGITLDHPSIQREYFGKWVLDAESLVIQYKKEADYEKLPESKEAWDHVISVDLGFEDSDAIAVIGWTGERPEAYLIEEMIKAKQGITELANQLLRLIEIYKPIKVVGDFGGLGKKIAEELRKRFGIPFEAAEKTRKLEYIELLNDALRTGRFRAKANSLFAQDSMLLEWEIDDEKQQRVIGTRFHSDIIDAVLYGFREALHFCFEPRLSQSKPGEREWFKEQERAFWKPAEEAWETERNEELFWQDSFED